MAFDIRLSEQQYNQLIGILNKVSNSYNPKLSAIAMELRDYVYRAHLRERT